MPHGSDENISAMKNIVTMFYVMTPLALHNRVKPPKGTVKPETAHAIRQIPLETQNDTDLFTI